MTTKDAIKDIEATAKTLEKKQTELKKAQNVKAIVDSRYDARRKKLEAKSKEILARQLGKLMAKRSDELKEHVVDFNKLEQEISMLKKRLQEIVLTIGQSAA